MHPRLTPAVVLAALVFGAAACSPKTPDVTKDPTGHVTIDRASGRILYPLDQQVGDTTVIDRANNLVLDRCTGTKKSADRAQVEDRPYGLWDVDRAKKYGLLGSDEEKQTSKDVPVDQARAQACADKTAQERAVFSAGSAESSPVTERVRGEAYTAATSDPEWDKAIADYGTCLKSKGLTPEGFMSAESNAIKDPRSEHAFTVAVDEATCNTDTRLNQRLGDLEAQYQLPLMKQNEAALSEERESTAAAIKAARDYLATHG